LSPASPDNTSEFIQIGFANATTINFINIYETYKHDFIDTVYVKNANTIQENAALIITGQQ